MAVRKEEGSGREQQVSIEMSLTGRVVGWQFPCGPLAYLAGAACSGSRHLVKAKAVLAMYTHTVSWPSCSSKAVWAGRKGPPSLTPAMVAISWKAQRACSVPEMAVDKKRQRRKVL